MMTQPLLPRETDTCMLDIVHERVSRASPASRVSKVLTQPLLPREIDTCMLDIVHERVSRASPASGARASAASGASKVGQPRVHDPAGPVFPTPQSTGVQGPPGGPE